MPTGAAEVILTCWGGFFNRQKSSLTLKDTGSEKNGKTKEWERQGKDKAVDNRRGDCLNGISIKIYYRLR